jgi:hypothetical protein
MEGSFAVAAVAPGLHGASLVSGLLGGATAGLASAIASDVVKALLSGVTSFVAEGGASLLRLLGQMLSSSTTPVLAGPTVTREIAVMALFGAVLVVPLLFLALIQSIVAQDLSLLLRAALLRLPLAILVTAIAVQLVELGLALTDTISRALAATAGAPLGDLLSQLSLSLGSLATHGLFAGAGAASAVLSGFAALQLALLAAGVAFLLFLELALRAAAISAATLFLPLALAGLVWSATAHWARRLAETILALVLSKLVIVGVLALAAATLSNDSGVPGAVQGIALLVIAALSPFLLLRLIPFIEAGAVGHLEGAGRRPVRAVTSAAQGVNLELIRGAGQQASLGSEEPSFVPPVPTGTALGGRESPHVAFATSLLDRGAAEEPGAAPRGGSDRGDHADG